MRSGERVRRALVITHGKPAAIEPALERLRRLAAREGVELLVDQQRSDDGEADLAVVLGGDGTMLRALRRCLEAQVPVFGVNFGNVGFLTAIHPDELESGVARVFAGDYRVIELATLEAEVAGVRRTAVNDIVATSSTLGRMVSLSWAVGGEDLGRLSCDGVICSTPSGSTGYNLSNGGPVMVWGLDAMAVTFIAPHSLHARPLVVGRSRELVVSNRTAEVSVTVLADGHRFAELAESESVLVRLGSRSTLLATLPEVTFFARYRETFAS